MYRMDNCVMLSGNLEMHCSLYVTTHHAVLLLTPYTKGLCPGRGVDVFSHQPPLAAAALPV